MKQNRYIVFLILLTFFVISMMTNIVGALNPEFIHDFKLTLTLASLLPFSFFIAYGVVSIPTGILLERYGAKKIMSLGFVMALFGSLLLVLLPGYLSAIMSLFLMGGGMAMLQVVINPLLRTAGGEKQYAFNSVLAQLVFGIASFYSPRWLSFFKEAANANNVQLHPVSGHGVGWLHLLYRLVPAHLPWLVLYVLFAVVTLLMILIILLSGFPKVQLSQQERAESFANHLRLIKKPVVILYFTGIFCYVGTEQGLNNNISLFLQSLRGYSASGAAAALGNFWGFMTLGNIVGLVLLKWADSRRVLIFFTAFAAAALVMALSGPASYAALSFSLVGFFLSVMYPVIFSLALNSMTDHHGTFAGILVTAIIGGAIIPLLMGAVSDHFGLSTGLGTLFLTLAYIFSIGFWAKPIINNK